MGVINNKLDYNTVNNFVKENSECELISKEYVKAIDKMNFKCKCGEIFETSFSKFKSRNKRQCNSCSGYVLSDVKHLNEKCLELKLKHFHKGKLNNKSKIVFEDESGYKFVLSYVKFKTIKIFPIFNVFNPYAFENVLKFVELNSNYLLLSKEYKGNDKKMLFKCPKHESFEMRFGDFQQGRRCPFCKNEKTSKRMTLNNPMLGVKGRLHPNFNPELNEEDRAHLRENQEYKTFKNKVRKRDNYKCVCCSNRALIVHHLNGYHWFEEGRTKVENAVTLCDNCHKSFHKEYGQKNNTKEQFKYFQENFKSTVL